MLDTAANNAFGTAAQSIKTNVANASYDPGTGPITRQDTETVTVVEPLLQIVKGVSDDTPDLGQTLTYTLTITHAAGSNSTAYDLILRDLVPAGLTLDPSSITVTGAGITSNASAGNQLDLTLDQLAVGGTATITYQATVANTLATPGATFDKNARLYWDSLAVDDANSVLTGTPDGTPDRDYGAQPGVIEGANVDSDPAQDTVRVTVNASTISGFVYQDVDVNGVLSMGDVPLTGVPIFLSGTSLSGLPISLSTMTADDGSYSFGNLPSGNYTLSETQPADYTDALETVGTNFGGTVSGAAGSNLIGTITIPAQVSQTGIGYNFGEVLTASLAGSVYRDDSNSGTREAGEPGISGITVTLTGTDVYGQSVTATAMTDGNGNYIFDNATAGLRPGNYTITEGTVPATYLDGRDTAGTAMGTAGNDVIYSIMLPQDTAATGYIFGELLPASLSGFVFNDIDGNAVKGANEAGINAVQITLTGTDDLGNPVSRTTFTDPTGAYTFGGLRPSNAAGYTLAETQPGGFTDGADAVGTGFSAPNSAGTAGNDVLSGIVIVNVAPGNNTGINYNFGETFAPGLTKAIVATSETFTGLVGGVERVAVGELVRYRVTLQLGESTFGDLLLHDMLPDGLQFINDGSATLVFVSSKRRHLFLRDRRSGGLCGGFEWKCHADFPARRRADFERPRECLADLRERQRHLLSPRKCHERGQRRGRRIRRHRVQHEGRQRDGKPVGTHAHERLRDALRSRCQRQDERERSRRNPGGAAAGGRRGGESRDHENDRDRGEPGRCG